MLDFEEAQLTEQNVRDLVYEEMKKYQVRGRCTGNGRHGGALAGACVWQGLWWGLLTSGLRRHCHARLLLISRNHARPHAPFPQLDNGNVVH